MTSKQEGRGGEGFIPVGVDTLGPVVREYLKSIVRNVTQRAWWFRMRLCTNSGAVYMRSSFDDVVLPVLLGYTCFVSVCPIYYWNETSRSVTLAKKTHSYV